MTTTPGRVFCALTFGLLLTAGCSETGLSPDPEHHNLSEEEQEDECANPARQLYFELHFVGDHDDWAGICGPELVALEYDPEGYLWIQEDGEDAIDCSDGAGTFMRVENVEGLFQDVSVFDWCDQTAITLQGDAKVYDNTGLSAMVEFTFDVDTAFWPVPSVSTAYAGEQFDGPSETAFTQVTDDGIALQVIDPSYDGF